MNGLYLVLGTLLILGSGCGKSTSAPSAPVALQPELSGIPERSVREVLSYAEDGAREGSRARIFLIAGGMDNANFAQEVIDQRRMWLNAGYEQSDIACYYTIPLQEQFLEDEAQYGALAEDLAHCRPASPKRVWNDLHAASQNVGADFLYVYVSSHGSRPLSKHLLDPKIGFPQKLQIGMLIDSIPELDQFFISMDALPDGMTGNLTARFSAIYEDAKSASDHLFTPRYLKAALEEWNVPKFVTIQACYSGGFIDGSETKWNEDTLPNLENISVITAARNDRASFGCDPGEERTYFGELYNQALAERVGDPKTIAWDELYEAVRLAVGQKEDAYRETVEPEVAAQLLPSEPQYFSNLK